MKSTVRKIKRYQNRKLYDTHQSCYVTLDELAALVRDGYDIQVLDNSTGEDITAATQIQLLFDRERRKRHTPDDVEFLSNVIREKDGSFTGYIRNLAASVDKGGMFGPSFVSKGKRGKMDEVALN